MKARIAPHGNNDSEKQHLKTESAVCVFRWCLVKIDFKSAFLQTGAALRDVLILPPRESNERQQYWLLLAGAYGLVNCGAKWQENTDHPFRLLGISQLTLVPQPFFKQISAKNFLLVAVKIVEDVLMAGDRTVVESMVEKIRKNMSSGLSFMALAHFCSSDFNFAKIQTTTSHSTVIKR